MSQTVAMLRFSVAVIAGLRGVPRYTAETLRQLQRMLSGTALILPFLMFVIGAVLAVFAVYLLRSVGAQSAVAAFAALSNPRIAIPLMFGYVFAAKIGCGLVAEIGSMAIADELAAYESTGVPPITYVVGTRLVAGLASVVLLFPVAVVGANTGSFIMAVDFLGVVSSGAFESGFWGLQGVGDYVKAFITSATIAGAILVVSCFYGFTVKGGPVEVGLATSRSMVSNLVLIHVLLAVMTGLLYGVNEEGPIGG